MEGSINHYFKGSEIKFQSVDLGYLKDLKKLLKKKFDVKSYIQKYYIKDYGWKYYLSFSKKEEILKFKEIGFALESHQNRLNELINSYKAWEITLVAILNLNKKLFTLFDVHKSFPFLCKNNVHY